MRDIGNIIPVQIDFGSDVLPFDLNIPLVVKGKIAEKITIIIDNDVLTGGDAASDIGLEVKVVDVIGDADADATDVLIADLIGGVGVSTQSIATTATHAATKLIYKIVTSTLENSVNVASILRLRLVLTAGIVYTAGIIRFRVIVS